MNALVTGGGGFLGLYIVEQLVARGDRVRVLCRGRYARLDELGVETVQADLRDGSAVAAACVGMETVFHVAALPGIWGPWQQFYDINTRGTEHVLRGCRQHGVRRLVYTSSPSVVYDGRPHVNADETLPYPDRYLCHYPHTKALAERAVLAAHDPDRLLTVSLRPHLIWGPRDNHLIPRLIRRARAGRLMQVGDGSNLISMSYVENVAAAHLKAADALAAGAPCGGEAYFINEREPVSLWSWVNDLLSRAGISPVKRRISAKSARRLGAALESFYSVLGLRAEPPMTRFLASQLSETHTYSVGKAERDFGFLGEIPVEEGLRRLEPDLRRLATAI
ncbi:MAG: NAD-dependent epimerase/dehydratase family protein [Planctomycetaceae bacterium]|nr:NAD-dependent epimerase/dehydratase family protein [Planctomycetaceae bacterium]